MSEVLGNEPRPRPRWLVPAALVAAGVGVAVLATRGPGSSPPGAASDPDPSPATSTSPTAVPSDALLKNACRSDVVPPRVSAGPLPPRTGLRLLVGDRDVQLVNVDLGTALILARSGGRGVTQLAHAGPSVVMVTHPACSSGFDGEGDVGLVDLGTGDVLPSGSGDTVLPGEPATVVELVRGGDERFRRLRSRDRAPLPPGWAAAATSGSRFVVTATPQDSNAPATIGIGDPATGRLTKTFGKGYIVAAAPDRAVWLAGTCRPGPCLLTSSGPDVFNTALQARSFPCCGAYSPDGRRVAFVLPRTEGELGPHPGPPSDVAVLDARTMAVQIVPGVVLPPKASVTIAWSADSRWLVLGADLGTRPLVLIWRAGMARPAAVPIPATTGGTTGAPALLVLAD
jgi:hypothetical protein